MTQRPNGNQRSSPGNFRNGSSRTPSSLTSTRKGVWPVSRRMVHRSALTKGRFIDEDRRSSASGAGPLCPGMSERAHRRHRLVRIRPPRSVGLQNGAAGSLDGRTGNQWRPGGDRDSLRVQGRTTVLRGHSDGGESPARQLQRLATLAWPVHRRNRAGLRIVYWFDRRATPTSPRR